MSCLYSLSDGVVPPQEATIHGDPALHENIRVAGSHTGLGFNAMVLAIVADRLAQPEGQWQPFKPSGLVGERLPAADPRRRCRPRRGAARGLDARRGGAAAGRRAAAAPAGPAPRPAVPGSCRARTARRPRGRASVRGTRSAR